MHWREKHLTTNTATLASLALPNSEIHLRGDRNHPLNLANLIPEPQNAALLYPSEDSRELNSDFVACLKHPLTLFVPDGSWRQARKVTTREPALESVTRVRLPEGPGGQYRLRHSPHADHLSTFEAIARAVGILEGFEIQKALEELFLKMVERTLWSRGKLMAADCTTGIPKAAFEASYLAGCQGSKKPL